ncbi:4927_t:CDS:2, partial [Cetraspora pellucida]
MCTLFDYALQLLRRNEIFEMLQFPFSIIIVFLICLTGRSLFTEVLKRSMFHPKGMHIYITGGSSGLGKEIAKLMASKGAHVTICAIHNLDDALEEIKEANDAAKDREDYENLKFNAIFADLSDYDESIRALNEASSKHNGRVPEVIFCCADLECFNASKQCKILAKTLICRLKHKTINAYEPLRHIELIFVGCSFPRIFIEQPIKEFEKTMQLNYFGTLYTIHEAVKRMAQQSVKGKVVLVSSLLGFCGFIGYSSYAPTKHAIKGLVECLRNELILYGIDVHCYFAGTLDTPGYHEE